MKRDGNILKQAKTRRARLSLQTCIRRSNKGVITRSAIRGRATSYSAMRRKSQSTTPNGRCITQAHKAGRRSSRLSYSESVPPAMSINQCRLFTASAYDFRRRVHDSTTPCTHCLITVTSVCDRNENLQALAETQLSYMRCAS